MKAEELRERFYRAVDPSIPNEWDVEEAVAPLVDVDEPALDRLFAQIPAVWPVSQSLCFSYMAAGATLAGLESDELSLWVHGLLAGYESGGLAEARRFMAESGGSIRREGGLSGMRLLDVRPRLQPYVNGLAGRELPLVAAEAASTDTENIYLPRELAVFADREENFLLYKLMVSFQWACIHAGSFAAPPDIKTGRKRAHPLDCFFAEFSEPEDAQALFHFFETARILEVLRIELPGLIRTTRSLLARLPLADPAPADRIDLLGPLQRVLTTGERPEAGQSTVLYTALELLDDCRRRIDANTASLEAVAALMPLLDRGPRLHRTEPLIFQGVLRLQEIRNLGLRDRMDKELRLMQAGVRELPTISSTGTPEAGEQGNSGGQQGDMAVLDLEEAQAQLPPYSHCMMYDAMELLNTLARKREKEGGATQTTGQTASATAGGAGQVFALNHREGSAPEARVEVHPYVYDEWDYRRKGYRKNWCVLRERPLDAVRGPFIEQTLARYRGEIRRLRYRFEQLRTTERFVRRQREGSDIDIDAVVESLADQAAGRTGSDRLFIRLCRDQRDIAVYFLVDMSNSTAGWVNQAIREALVLLCEALEVLNDRYGIYGFSGMRRLRCEVYPVKALEERYTEEVRRRISAIAPREYTRMGPAIRHMNALFASVEARIRLLIILSDGKPEDYDDYKGEYAIEDTRRALLEAKAGGIHPFCITVDRQAREYMRHMYGEVNAICIDKVEQLPARMAEIYRTLTS
ncbi:MAG: nitric oxide reductase activation protein NorD [Desulfobulbus sp.]|jgi:nitric oxide reductase NorD protein